MTISTLAPGSVTVRCAELQDVPWLLAEARVFADYYEMPWLIPADAAVAAEIMGRLVEAGPFFVAERDGSRVGFLAALVGPHGFNPAVIVATELFWWVTPSARGTSAGFRLLDAFERFAAVRAHKVALSTPPQCPVDDATLLRRGYALYERSWMKEAA